MVWFYAREWSEYTKIKGTENILCNLVPREKELCAEVHGILTKRECYAGEELVKETRRFYMYSPREDDANNYDFDAFELTYITVEKRNGIEGRITRDDALYALKNTKNDKSTGSDGYTTEFFKFFFASSFFASPASCRTEPSGLQST